MSVVDLILAPPLILLAGAVLYAITPAAGRVGIALVVPVMCLLSIWRLPDGTVLSLPFLNFELQWLEADKLRRLFATVFALMALAGGLFAAKSSRAAELAAGTAYAAGAVGVALAGDLITLFVYWECMAIFSTIVVWLGGTESARQAGIRYALVHLLGGVLLKLGIVALVFDSGSIDIRPLSLDQWFMWLILAGVLINAAAPPLSAWLADAYPEASAGGTVFLSAFTTKAAVLALVLLFPGQTLLVWVGLYMIFYGIIYALLENDMRRILAYSIVNQVGFMVCGVGIGTEMALNGVAAHAFSHIIYKGLLLMSAGAVLYQTGLRKCTDLGGLYQSMPVTMLCGVVGALAISAFPFTSGFISKSMISQSAADQHLAWVWFALVAASAGVFFHAGIKFPWFVFFQKDSGLRPPDPHWTMRAAMLLFAWLCIGLGLFPDVLYFHLPYAVDYEPYTSAHLLSQFQLLLFAGLAFFICLPWMKRTLTISLDTDWLYRRAAPWLLSRSLVLHRNLERRLRVSIRRSGKSLNSLLFRYHGPEGYLARSMPTGSMLLWVAVMLVVILISASVRAL